jgi:hypothetical protein
VVRLAAAAAAVLLAAGPLPLAAAQPCTMDAADRAWLSDALDQWRRTQREELRFTDVTIPTVYAIDAACTWTIPGGDMAAAQGTPHPPGSATLPSVGSVPVGPISFAFAADGFAMSLPSVWRTAGVTSAVGLERLMTGVLLHEIMHTRQSAMVEEVAEPAARAHGIGDALSDDLLQERFEKRPGYAAAYRAERDALYAAAAAPDDAAARGLAAHALHLMRDRRARFLSGGAAHFAVFDDVFLTMEGAGQWLIYRYFLSPQGGGASVETAVKETRRGKSQWSQDEGLALVLVLDRLLPDWRARAFRSPDWLAEPLLAAAIEETAP